MEFALETKTSEYRHWIVHIWISLCTKFQLKLAILFFLDQVCPKKGISSQKRKNWTNITIEFCMLELD